MKTPTQLVFITLALLVLPTLISPFSTAHAQGTTAFTYQGQLTDGGKYANGTYTMIFNLYDAASGGNLIGGPITTTANVENGLFTVNLDFGAGAFNGNSRWLDITVQSGADSEELSPRVQIQPTPYALCAATLETNAVVTGSPLFSSGISLPGWNASVGTYSINQGVYGGGPFPDSLILSNAYGLQFALADGSGANSGAYIPGGLFVGSQGLEVLGMPGETFLIDYGDADIDDGDVNVANGDVNALAFNTTSDRNLKEKLAPINSNNILAQVVNLPISSWSFKADAQTRHIGPMAQDFYAAFDVGTDDRHIATVDEDGVALAAIQGLNQKLEEDEKEKDAKIDDLEKRLADLEKLVKSSVNQQTGGAK
ncbi:MAG TPA: tail fiber domain-containing protein [Candidatus Sulfotelmatobacter sp.]|nr:tail fiber domain-containing protein [Candidatus Sulfotelmatobacter sp.]